MQPPIERIDVSTEELEALLEQAKPALADDGYQKLKGAIRTLGYVTELLENQEATLASLRRLLCHSSTEKTEKVLKQAGIKTDEKKPKPSATGTAQAPKSAVAGHGRNGAAAYRGARKVQVPHASLKAGDPCPNGQCGGKVYPQRDPGVLVRIQGQAPIAATVYELEKLRCHLCGDVFTAAAPEDVGEKKYDETAASMIAMLRYGSGFPWYRLQGLEESLGIPLPVATQCEIVAETAAHAATRLAGTDSPGGARRSGAQRRYFDARAVAGPGCGHFGGADRSVHQRDGMDLPRSPDRVVFHRVQTRRRESGRGAEATARRPAATHPDVRRTVEECTEVGRPAGHAAGERLGAWPPELRGSDRELP
jgi:hypothetical protein